MRRDVSRPSRNPLLAWFVFRAVPHPHSIAMENVMTAMTAMAIVTVRRDAGICPILTPLTPLTPICIISTYENVFLPTGDTLPRDSTIVCHAYPQMRSWFRRTHGRTFVLIDHKTMQVPGVVRISIRPSAGHSSISGELHIPKCATACPASSVLVCDPLVTVMALTFMDEGGITFRSLPVDGSMAATEPGLAMMILLPSASVTTSYVESKPEACLGDIDTNDAARVSKTANNVIWNLWLPT